MLAAGCESDAFLLRLQQLHAVDSALSNAKRELVQDHMEHCLGDGMKSGRLRSNQALKEFKTSRKVSVRSSPPIRPPHAVHLSA